MRLADFITANIEPILVEWEAFARDIWPGAAATDPATLRDHAETMLHATVADMESSQSDQQQSDKSKGKAGDGPDAARVNREAAAHGVDRVGSGFDLAAVISEYRALRASVIRLWRESRPSTHLSDLSDITRFNESIDQSLTQAVVAYSQQVGRDRAATLEQQKETSRELRELNDQLLVSSVKQHELTERAEHAAAAMRAAKEEAESANSAKDEFLAVLSHELRTPLSAILLWSKMLVSGGVKPEDYGRVFGVIRESADAQRQLIEDLLDVSRMISGKLRLNVRKAELVPVVQAAVETVHPMAEAKGVVVEVSLDERAGRVRADPDRIQQVVWNLLNNAVKFTDRGGRASVRLQRLDGELQIQVADTGRGISAEFLPNVFDRFRQADASTTRAFGGLGLGLSISRQIVELHGGTIRAESAGEGKGATFTVELPLGDLHTAFDGTGTVAAATDAASAPFAPSPVLRGVRVLVVEDESNTRAAIVALLEQCEADVTAVGSAALGVAAFREGLMSRRYDVLVSDLGMPVQDGYEMMREIRDIEQQRAERHVIAAVALTAYAREEDRARATAAGFRTHIPKPVEASALVDAVTALVRESRQTTSAE